MVDPGLARGMAEFCTGWVLRAHLGMDAYRQDAVWRNGQIPPLAPQRRVTILGMGELGRAVAAMLAPIGFDLVGYSASGRPLRHERSLRHKLPRSGSGAGRDPCQPAA